MIEKNIDIERLQARIEMAITNKELEFKKNNDERSFEAKLAAFIATGIITAIKHL